MTTYLCPRCQGNHGDRAKCTLCGGSDRVVWDGGATAHNPTRTAGGSLSHVERWRLEQVAPKAVRP